MFASYMAGRVLLYQDWAPYQLPEHGLSTERLEPGFEAELS